MDKNMDNIMSDTRNGNTRAGELVTIEYLFNRIWWLRPKTIEAYTTHGKFPFATIYLNKVSKRPRKYFVRAEIDAFVEMACAEVNRPDNNQNIEKHEESCCDTL